MRSHHAHVLELLQRDEPAMQSLLRDLVQRPSLGGSDDEISIQHALAELLTAEGLEVDLWPLPLESLAAEPDFPGVEVARREAWGLVGRLPGQANDRSLMFNGHVDVVPPGDLAAWHDDPFSGRIEDGRLYGRGACDMKGGLVSAFAAVRAIRRSGVQLKGDLLLACVVGEEDGGLGTYGLLRRGWRADACVIPEPTSLDLVPANAGALTFRLRVRGRATHASRRTEGVSAIDCFWPVWRALRELEAARNAAVDPLMRRWSVPYALSIGTLQCGDWASSVPDLLTAEGRLGVALDESIPDARRSLEDAVRKASDADPWLRDHPVEVEWWGGQFASGRLSDESDLLQRVQEAHRRANDASHVPSIWGAPYGSDLRLLTGLSGIPTLHYGPGDAASAHAPDESVSLEEVFSAARTLAVLALDTLAVEN